MRLDIGMVRRAAKRALAAQVPDRAAGLAYYAFLAVPSVLLLALGAVGAVWSRDDIARVIAKARDVMPPEAITLLTDNLGRQADSGGGNLALIVGGFALALWSGSGAMNSLMRALNGVYGVRESRSFVKQRLTALGMLCWVLFALVLVVGMLVLGPLLSAWLGDATGKPGLISTLWWTAQWPILLAGVGVSFAGVLFLGPDRENRWRIGSTGAILSTLLWVTISGGFAFYTSKLGSFNATWGSLSVVVVTLMWLWLSAIALLVGAAVDAEADGAPPVVPRSIEE